MKLFIQSILISIIVHALYIIGHVVYGIYLTNSYVPKIVNSYENVAYLQNEVAFGYVINPFLMVGSFIIVTIVAAIALQIIKRLRDDRLTNA
ncbi:hypothetical protein [Alkalihalobacterium elongatum]|uniref:hypothetical protein n=1 Tax=Alkalihalobacterium elongatum TaxID=2675466 RepID=UPI001C200C87|nr:hypothetical protein [Alkalihalobacterium elongatum]